MIDPPFSPSDLRALAEQSNAWPFEQAKAIVARLKKKPKDEVLFETGYGPSGLPHIGTFGEGIGIGVRKGNDLLRQALNWALFRVWEKGRYTDLWLRYFSISPF